MVPGQSQLNCDSWTCSFWCRALAVVRIASEGERGRESMTSLAASNYARGWPVRGGFTAQRRIYTIEPQKQNKQRLSREGWLRPRCVVEEEDWEEHRAIKVR
jgi:hypothetical protein